MTRAASGNGRLHVVSVSLGSPSRDASIETEMLGRPILLERRGTNGDLAAAGDLIADLDGRVDAIGLGGIDLYVMAGGRRYQVRDAGRLAARARTSPVVCGAGLKHTLERRVVDQLDDDIGWRGRKVLMLSAADRFGMAEALDARGADLVMGDLIFLLGIPIPLRGLRSVDILARVTGPLVTRLPFTWLYPTGSKQDAREAGRERWFRDAAVIAGDFLFVKRYAPDDLRGKIVLTNTTTRDDMQMLRARGVTKLITTTPRFDGRSLSTNLLEAALVALAGRHPLEPEDYLDLIERLELQPNIEELSAPTEAA